MNTSATRSYAVQAWPCSPQARPTLVTSSSELHAQWGTRTRGYQRCYYVRAATARCQLQRVRVQIQYHHGRTLLADYRQTYFEFFQFDHDQADVVDTHDFDLARDGWRQSVIVSLLNKHRVQALAAGEPHLTVKKQFVIGPGQIHDACPQRIHDGASFGLLRNGITQSGNSIDSNTVLRLARGDGTWQTIATLPACPAGYPIAGTGRFTTSHGYRTFEHFRYRFASMHGTYNDRGIYSPFRIH